MNDERLDMSEVVRRVSQKMASASWELEGDPVRAIRFERILGGLKQNSAWGEYVALSMRAFQVPSDLLDL